MEFTRGQQVLVERTSGAVETWFVLMSHCGRTTVVSPVNPEHGWSDIEAGAETMFKSPRNATLAAWQETHGEPMWASVRGPHAVPDMGVLAQDAGLFTHGELDFLASIGFEVEVAA